jgi:ATP:corrinoid adenosyltransferase
VVVEVVADGGNLVDVDEEDAAVRTIAVPIKEVPHQLLLHPKHHLIITGTMIRRKLNQRL